MMTFLTFTPSTVLTPSFDSDSDSSLSSSEPMLGEALSFEADEDPLMKAGGSYSASKSCK